MVLASSNLGGYLRRGCDVVKGDYKDWENQGDWFSFLVEVYI